MSVDQPATFADFVTTPAPLAPLDLFVDHQSTGRSGHLGHAMFQRHDGTVFAFYPSCSSDDPGRHGTSGHSAAGWMEFKRSEDYGLTWSEGQPLDYSRQAYDAKLGHAIFTEKSVVTRSGAIVLFHLLSDISEDALWEPYLVPTSTRSIDGGRSFSAPINIGTERGRVYSAIYSHDTIYALKFNNDAVEDFCGTTSAHVYTLFASRDDGASFSPVADLPFDTLGRGYGTLCRLLDNRLIAYVYNKNDETHADYVISNDGGRTWTEPAVSTFTKRVRNPQMVSFAGGYFMHGRSGSYGEPETKGHFVIYYSKDGIHWDEGSYLAMRQHGQGAYSNNLVVRSPGGVERLLIHASHAYSADSTDIATWWVDQA